ncbi:MAG: hypothetical protein SFX18_08000 [Pirellulales bacterium]|nr:hypothetical protein [Pirellulales bacterium]
MPRLTCILPVPGPTDAMEPTLVSFLEHRPPDCEILAVFNRPYDDPYQLAGEVTFLQAPPRGNVLDCLNFALEQVQSPYLFIGTAGIQVTAGWADLPLAHFQDPRVATIAPQLVSQAQPQRLLASGWGYDPRRGPVILNTSSGFANTGDDPTAIGKTPGMAPASAGPLLQAGFYRTMALELLGAKFCDKVGPAWASVDLGLMLAAVGYDHIHEPNSVVLADAAQFDRDLAAASNPGYTRGYRAEQLYQRNCLFESWLDALARHPLDCLLEWAGQCWRPAAWLQLAGRMRASAQYQAGRLHREKLRDTRLACAALLRANRAVHMRIDPATLGESSAGRPIGPSRGNAGQPTTAGSTESQLRRAA